MLEWNLPPLRFDALGDSGASTRAGPDRPFFATALVTDPAGRRLSRGGLRRGVQLDLQLQVMHRLPMMLSVGYAHRLRGQQQGKDELMVSLKVL